MFIGFIACNQPATDKEKNTDNSRDSLNGQMKSSADSGKWLIFETDDYSIEYPGNWEIDTTGKDGTSFVLFENRGDKNPENILLMFDDLKGKSFDEYIAVSIKEIEKVENRELIANEKLSLNGMQGHNLTFTSIEEKNSLKVVQYIFLKGDSACGLQLMCELDKFDSYIIVGEKIMSTFRLK
ncbi:MAG: hypothetical protein A2W91_10975 [Bacteroidetes bacterium GWF2_38_335]|nr:MAG: hypothetical protein A2W91_10975 [Bacteroidetes bacterium GWF2_38_335]OFY81776.1 MAG: hypothetical protein A2281_06065 [Bacteroidetes bacterium RIFOXYA12_FULL_38_20]HBS87846.1 hypothetical protein [Bacteroidales bacterium]